jgi:hypothetical protein
MASTDTRMPRASYHAVEDVSATTLLRFEHGDAHHVEHDLVRDQLAPVEIFLDCRTDRSPPGDVLAEQIAGGDVRHVEVRGDQRTLGSLSCPGRRDQQNPHGAILPRGTPH